MDNPFIESFNGRLRDEHLNTELFFSVADAEDEEEKVTPNLVLRCRKKKSLFRRSSKRMWLYNGRRSRTKSGSLHPHPWALSSSSVLMRKVNTSPLRQRSPLGSPCP
jgi:hypothetical protein